jgi:hypothetical protein
MRPTWLAGLALTACAAVAGMLVTGCFNPQKPACAFSCAEPPHTCPSGYLCGADNLCHDPRNTQACGIVVLSDAGADTGDAAQDAGARDSGATQQ